jgi:hypothetical protein
MFAALFLTLAIHPAGAVAPRLRAEISDPYWAGDPDDGEHFVPVSDDSGPTLPPASVKSADRVAISSTALGGYAAAVAPTPRVRMSRLASLWLVYQAWTLHR